MRRRRINGLNPSVYLAVDGGDNRRLLPNKNVVLLKVTIIVLRGEWCMGKEESRGVNLKSLLECGNTMIVCDTNVYLHIYQYTPGYCDFAFDCLNSMQDYLIVPRTIYLEYLDNYERNYEAMRGRITGAKDRCDDVIIHAKRTITSVCEHLSGMGFSDISELEESLDDAFEKQINEIEDFFEDRKAVLELIAERWDEDLLLNLFGELNAKGRILEQFTQEELFGLCKKGQARYKKHTPPGFEDNGKDGIAKYGDYLWWEEVLRYANDNKKNIVLVTDDIKKDWCEEDEEEIVLRKELVREFKHRSKQEIYFFTSKSFYDKYADDFNIIKPDVVQYALQMTDKKFFDRVNEDVFAEIKDDLLYNAIDYINEETSNLGYKDLDDFELVDSSFRDAELIEIDAGEATYEFRYDVTVSVRAFVDGGTDEDTEERIETNCSYHEFSGIVTVSLKRDADIFSDFEEEKFYYDTSIVGGELVQTEYNELGEAVYCSECGAIIGYDTDNYSRSGNGDPICNDCMKDDGNRFVCPRCNKKYDEGDRGSSGQFCRYCEDELDL